MNKEKQKNIHYLMGYIEVMNIIKIISESEIESAKRQIEEYTEDFKDE